MIRLLVLKEDGIGHDDDIMYKSYGVPESHYVYRIYEQSYIVTGDVLPTIAESFGADWREEENYNGPLNDPDTKYGYFHVYPKERE